MYNRANQAKRMVVIKYVRRKQKIRDYMKNREHLKRSNGRGIGVPAEVRRRIVETCNNRCIAPGCGKGPVTMDHVIPVSLGGEHAPSNIQPLCRSCNSAKGVGTTDYRTIDFWFLNEWAE